MTDEKFEELVNSYLDNELSAEDLEIFKAELESSFARRSIFVFYRRLHNASCAALTGSKGSSRERRARRGQLGMKIYYLVQFGMAAACFVLAFVVLTPFFSNNGDSYLTTTADVRQTQPPPLDLSLVKNTNVSSQETPHRVSRVVIPAHFASLPDFKGLTLQPVDADADTITATVHFFNKPDISLGQVDFVENASPVQQLQMQMQLMLRDRDFPIFEEPTPTQSARVIDRDSREQFYRTELANFYFPR